MDDVDVFEAACPLQVDIERIENLGHSRAGRNASEPWRKAQGVEVPFGIVLVSKGARFDFAMRLEFAREKLDMDSGTAIDVGRKFIGEKGDFHGVNLS